MLIGDSKGTAKEERHTDQAPMQTHASHRSQCYMRTQANALMAQACTKLGIMAQDFRFHTVMHGNALMDQACTIIREPCEIMH